MPYKLSLQSYCLPEFYAEPAESWVRRLEEVSPSLPNLDRLVFRYFASKNPDGTDRGWLHPDRGVWTLYSAKPIRLVEKERAAQFEKHWSELDPWEQPGRQAVVSDYQHFMWHSQGLYVKPFLILQGEWGGTPQSYTPQEVAFLEASGCVSEPVPIGFFAPCPFDERVVKQIASRDRLLQCSNDLDALAKRDTPEGKASADAEAEVIRRTTMLDTWKAMAQPSVEFLKSYYHTKASQRVLPDAPEGLADRVAQFPDHFLQHGHLIGANTPRHRKTSVLVQ